MPQKAFGQQRRLGTAERSNLFVNRRLRHAAFDWTAVDRVKLLTALDLAVQTGCTISFAPANGGIGVNFRVWQGKVGDSEHCGSPEEMNELLELFIIGKQSTSEDACAVMEMRLNLRQQPAAD